MTRLDQVGIGTGCAQMRLRQLLARHLQKVQLAAAHDARIPFEFLPRKKIGARLTSEGRLPAGGIITNRHRSLHCRYATAIRPAASRREARGGPS